MVFASFGVNFGGHRLRPDDAIVTELDRHLRNRLCLSLRRRPGNVRSQYIFAGSSTGIEESEAGGV